MSLQTRRASAREETTLTSPTYAWHLRITRVVTQLAIEIAKPGLALDFDQKIWHPRAIEQGGNGQAVSSLRRSRESE